MPKFKFDEVVKCTIDGQIFPVKTVSKIAGGFFYMHKNIWIPESFLEKTSATIKITDEAQKLTKPSKKMFAYMNLRTTKVDHYQWEWAGNQFSKRAPQYDIEAPL